MNLIKKLCVCIILLTGFAYPMEEDKNVDNLGFELIKAIQSYILPSANITKRFRKDENLEKLKIIIKKCIEKKSFRNSNANLFELDTFDESGNTPLIIAAKNGYKELAQLLIDADCSVDAKNNFGLTALMIASFHGHIDIVKILSAGLADLNIRDSQAGFTAVMYADLTDNNEIVDFLLKNGANFTEQDKSILLRKKIPQKMQEESSCNLS